MGVGFGWHPLSFPVSEFVRDATTISERSIKEQKIF